MSTPPPAKAAGPGRKLPTEVRYSLAEIIAETREDLVDGGLAGQLMNQSEINRAFRARKGRRAGNRQK